nr:L-lactate permease [Lactobacillus crispatus]
MVLAVFSFKVPVLDTASGALEGIIMGIWADYVCYWSWLYMHITLLQNLGGMEIIQMMLATISTDKRIIVLIIGLGIWHILESFPGFWDCGSKLQQEY